MLRRRFELSRRFAVRRIRRRPANRRRHRTPASTRSSATWAGDFTHLPARDNVYIGADRRRRSPRPRIRSIDVQRAPAQPLRRRQYGLRARANISATRPSRWRCRSARTPSALIFDEPKTAHLGMDLLQRADSHARCWSSRSSSRCAASVPTAATVSRFPPGTPRSRSRRRPSSSVIWDGSAACSATRSRRTSRSSRLHDNRHYLSDVVFGAAVGTIAGRTVTQHGRTCGRSRR